MEADDNDVDDSRTDERACCCRMLGSSCDRFRVTGGLLSRGLACLVRTELFDNTMPGEYEDMEVGVEETLNGPGDSEYRVEGVVESA